MPFNPRPCDWKHSNVAGAVIGIRTYAAAIVWVSRPALNPPHHKSTRRRGRQSLTRRLPHYPPPFSSLSGPCLPWPSTAAHLGPDRSPPRPPMLARLDPHTSCLVRLGSRSWSTLAHDFGPPWPAIRLVLQPAMGIHSEIPSRNSAVQLVRSRCRDLILTSNDAGAVAGIRT